MADQCLFCGGLESYEDPIRFDTWNLPFVSEPFPAHTGCAADFLSDRLTEQELLRELA